MKEKYTPAPWINQGEDSESGIPFIQIETNFRGEKTMFIARVEASHETTGFKYEISDEDRANADLIAAAPDLLEACEALLAVDSYWWQQANGADDLIRAAVKKAKGE